MSQRLHAAGSFRRYLASSRAASSTADSDVLIVGGGVVGCALARQLASKAPSLSVTIVDASSGPRPLDTAVDALPHPRSYALSPASLRILGLPLEPGSVTHHKPTLSRLGYYQSMQVWEANQPASLLFHANDLGDSSTQLGAVTEDAHLQASLWSLLEQDASCQLLTNTTVQNVSLPSRSQDGLVEVELQQTDKSITDSIPGKSKLQTRLLVAADGGNSAVRSMAGIGTKSHDYGQTALTFTVELAQPHRGRAYQRFVASGPLALLPTFSDRHAIIVWSTTPEQAKYWLDKGHESSALVDHMNGLLQQGPELLESLFYPDNAHIRSLPVPFQNILYGVDKVMETLQYGPAMGIQELQAPNRFAAPPLMTAIASRQFSFPLKLQTASSYTLPRLALAGDAAHTVHPMAGQGLNLGLQDVDHLVQVIHKATDSGMDPSSFLSDYESGRQRHVSMTVGGIHALHRIFHEQDTMAKHVKSLGMNFVQSVGPLRRRLVQAACWGTANGATGVESSV